MILSSITYEPWESWYMWFLMPGVLTWIGGTIWWARKRKLWLPIAAQVFGNVEVVVGGGAAYMAGLVHGDSSMVESGFWDPSLQLANHAFVAEVAVIGWVLHWLLLVGTLVMAIVTTRSKTIDAQQGV